MTRLLLLPTIAITLLTRLEAGQVQVNMVSGKDPSPTLFDSNTAAQNALSGGTSADGDGFVLQLGYYDQATTSNNFLGNWVPLSGEGSANMGTIPGSSPAQPFNKTTIGDVEDVVGNGAFSMGLTFVSGSATGNNLPPSTAFPLAVRFYDGFTIASSNFYNVVSSDAWTWKDINSNPPEIPIEVSLTGNNLEWLSIFQGQNANTAFHTTLLVPEPGATLLMAAGLAGLAARRRAWRKVESDRNYP